MYLDDTLCATAGEEKAAEASQLVQCTLLGARFVTHPTKSIWGPTQRLMWLGFMIDLSLGQIEVPVEKLSALKRMLQQAPRKIPCTG